MKFSIIVPIYNAEKWISRCLDSIQAQTFREFEVIIIDDGCTDNSCNIISKYCKTDLRFKCFHYENGGVGIARRRGISQSNGDYIIFVDSDDSINPELLENIYSYVSDNQIDIIRYQCNLINDSAKKDPERYNFLSSHVVSTGIDALKQWSCPGKKYAVYWLFCTKREIFKDLMLIPNLHCYEDVALLPLVIASSNTVVTIDYVGYNYIRQPNSITNNRSIEAERHKVKDFFAAYDFAVANFKKLTNISSNDITFLINDYNRRLKSKYDSLPDILKAEFAEELNSRLG